MLGAVRGLSAPPHGFRFLWSLIAWISIAGGLLAATRAHAQTPARSDSVAAPFVPSATTATSAPSAGTRAPKHPSYALHLHGGLFAPIDVNSTSPTIGLRLGRFVGPHLQGGLLTGWTFKWKNLEEPVNGLPGLKPHLVLARVDGYLVPAMAFLQVNLTEKRFLAPYAGVALGYEWLTLTANDYRTDQSANLSYANWAWESWAGFGMRLGRDVRVDGELFYNGGSLERDVTDANGQTWREAVDANGVGARVGLEIPF